MSEQAATDVHPHQVHQATESLNENNQELAGVLHDLEVRLAPVMRPLEEAPQDPAALAGSVSPNGTAPLADQVWRQAHLVGEATRQVRILMDRLEV